MTELDAAREELQKRFPDLQPIRHPPSLQTINGIGTGIYGRRDFDAESNSYVKTQCLCFAFIPLVALGSYRVVSAGGDGWYFLGRVPLSPFARGWNYLLVLLLIMFGGGWLASVGWNRYTHSNGYLQAQAFVQAQEKSTRGDYGGAAVEFARIAQSGAARSSDALTALQDLRRNHFLDQPGPIAISILTSANTLTHELQQPTGGTLFQEGLKYIETNLAARPRDSEAMRNYLFKTCPNKAPINAVEIPLLQALIATEPQNPQPVSDLAQVYERDGNSAAGEALLIAHQNNLGETEGARILGQLYYSRGDMEAAYPLLDHYTAGRLKRLQVVQQEYFDANQRSWNNGIQYLDRGNAPQSWYKQYDKCKDDAAKQQMINEYMTGYLAKDAALQKKLAAFKRAAEVVPVALDLGIARLAHAQSLADPVKRKNELLEIEQLFLQMEAVAGESDDYHLFYGQVCYWLGKREEGRKQFDDLIVNNDRAPQVLIAVAQRLREIGETAEALQLGEEAYAGATDEELKKSCAQFLSMVAETSEAKAKWLQLADPNDTSFSLNKIWIEILQASENGDTSLATSRAKALLDTAGKLPKSASNLNMMGLANQTLFQISGDAACLKEAQTMLAEACALKPKDSILLTNRIEVLRMALYLNQFGAQQKFYLLQQYPDLDQENWHYRTKVEFDLLAEKIHNDPLYKDLLACSQRLVTLAPSDTDAWARLYALHMLVNDFNGQRDVVQRRRAAAIDLQADVESVKKHFAGESNEIMRTAAAERLAAINAQLGPPSSNFNAPTRALLLHDYVDVALDYANYGLQFDAGLVIARAEECLRQKPSHRAQKLLQRAHAFRCLTDLAGRTPAVGDFRRAHPFLPDLHSLGWLLSAPGPVRDAILEHPDFKQVARMIQTNRESFTEGGTCAEWLILRHTAPELAAKIADNMIRLERCQLQREFELLIAPNHFETLLNSCLYELVRAQPDAAEKLRRQALDRGFPIPPLPNLAAQP